MKITRNVVKEAMFENIKPGECFTNSSGAVFIKTQIIYTKDGCVQNAVNLETGFYHTFYNGQIVTRKPNANLIIGD